MVKQTATVIDIDRGSGVPLYKQIEVHLRDRIAKGRLRPGERLPSIRGLSKEYGVNHLTMRQAIRRLASEGFLTSSQGRGTFVKETVGQNTKVSLIVPNLAFPLPDGITRGVRQVLDTYGIQNSGLFNSHDDFDEEVKNIQFAIADGIQGLILFSLMGPAAVVTALRAYLSGYPVVWVDRYIEGVPTWHVSSDNRGGGYTATEHLISQGRSRIAFISEMNHITNKLRHEGYRDALAAHGLYAGPELLGVIPPTAGDPGSAVRHVLSQTQRPDAIFFSNDIWAMAGLQQIKAAGFRVPDDIAIVGFDSMPTSEFTDPPLTSVRQDGVALGQAAAELLIKQQELPLEERLIKPESRVVPVQLVRRQSA